MTRKLQWTYAVPLFEIFEHGSEAAEISGQRLDGLSAPPFAAGYPRCGFDATRRLVLQDSTLQSRFWLCCNKGYVKYAKGHDGVKFVLSPSKISTGQIGASLHP